MKVRTVLQSQLAEGERAHVLADYLSERLGLSLDIKAMIDDRSFGETWTSLQQLPVSEVNEPVHRSEN